MEDVLARLLQRIDFGIEPAEKELLVSANGFAATPHIA